MPVEQTCGPAEQSPVTTPNPQRAVLQPYASNGFRLEGIDEDDNSGLSASTAGDLNGDGFQDLIIGASREDGEGAVLSGETYVIFGKGSGFAALIDLSSLDGTNGFRLDGAAPGDVSGFSVSSAGDVNGDGFDDLIIGAYGADPGGNSAAGQTHVVFGKSSGFAAVFNLSALDGTNGFRLEGIAATDLSGFSVSSAGDVNGDGFDDVIIGARHADPDGNQFAGATYIAFGKGTGFAACSSRTAPQARTGRRLCAKTDCPQNSPAGFHRRQDRCPNPNAWSDSRTVRSGEIAAGGIRMPSRRSARMRSRSRRG